MDKITKIIALEGCDGCGKTTMAKTLKEYINKNIPEYDAEIIAYPHKGYFGYEKIREILSGKIHVPPDVVQSLFIMNMIDSYENYVNPYFNTTNKILIMDRSIISTIVYNKLAKGRILESIIQYLYNDNCFKLIDIDNINKVYCNMKGSIDKIFFLSPPLDVVMQHSRNRMLENKKIDDNDKIDSVIKQYNYYKDIYESFKNLNTSINKIYIIDNWNYAISEQLNYLQMQNIILNYLNI